jgi:hypothetical protein
VLIYRGCGTDMAGWAVTTMAGIYTGFAIINDAHLFSKSEMFFNGVLVVVVILIIMRWQNISQRLAFAAC